MTENRIEVVFSLIVQHAIRSFFRIESSKEEQDSLKQITFLEYEEAYRLLDSKFTSLSIYIERCSVIEYQRLQYLMPERMDQIELKKKLLKRYQKIASKVPYYLINNLSKIEISEIDAYRLIASLKKYTFVSYENEDNLIENLKQLAILDFVIKKLENPLEAKNFLEQVYDYYQQPVTNLSRGQLSIAALYGYLQSQKIEHEKAKTKILTNI